MLWQYYMGTSPMLCNQNNVQLLLPAYKNSSDLHNSKCREVRMSDMWPITNVFPLNTQWIEVQLCFVCATLYDYFLLCSIWQEVCKFAFRLVINPKRWGSDKVKHTYILIGPVFFLKTSTDIRRATHSVKVVLVN